MINLNNMNNNNIYQQRQRWKLVLFVIAIFIGVASLIYTDKLVKKLTVEERKKIELWAEGTKALTKIDFDNNQDVSFVFKVIENNTTVPVILTTANDQIISYRNIPEKKNQDEYLHKQLLKMKKDNEPIKIEFNEGNINYIYYKKSTILAQLTYYPYVQMGVIILFIFIAYLAFSSTRKAEQNQVWVGMAKETAHQLGTPISSLIAWVELLKEKLDDKKIISELQNDVIRLEKITERFSKIGSVPILELENIIEVLNGCIDYIKTRTSDTVAFITNYDPSLSIAVPLNRALFEWVVENVMKNSIDAMKGEGFIEVSLFDDKKSVVIDIKDTGKGISKSKYKTIFRPGYTTKKRGWGLGLSLTKRIIESYHQGKIFVSDSEINSGTTIRIILKK